jgi:hypothetical protein
MDWIQEVLQLGVAASGFFLCLWWILVKFDARAVEAERARKAEAMLLTQSLLLVTKSQLHTGRCLLGMEQTFLSKAVVDTEDLKPYEARLKAYERDAEEIRTELDKLSRQINEWLAKQ